MHDYSDYFPVRVQNDELDIAPLVLDRLNGAAQMPLVLFGDETIHCGTMKVMVASYCAAFAQRGLRRGDRVAVMVSNTPQHVALVYATIISGLVWVPINTKLRADGIGYILDHAKPDLFVVESEFLNKLPPCPVDVVTIAALAGAAGSALPALALHHSDTLCIIYTSGTTGAPKGVLFTHRMMRIAVESVLLVANIAAHDRVFLWEPLCHIGGAQMLLVPFLVQAPLFIVPRFSATAFWTQWCRARATHLHYLGGILDILMRLPSDAQPADAKVKIAWGAGASAGSWDMIRARLGCELRECYGMTECSSFATVNTSGKPGSIGKPLPWLTLSLLDENDQPVPQGQMGEIVLASALEGVFLPGYLDNPKASAKALRGGRLHTGDMAWQDADGDYVFVGRQTDSMRVRGENVSAWEVERAFAQHPAIGAAAAVGVASDIGEQEILLYVQFKPGEIIDWSVLSGWIDDRLAPFQQPRFYQAVTQFPLTPSQRIRKHLLPRDLSTAWDRRQAS